MSGRLDAVIGRSVKGSAAVTVLHGPPDVTRDAARSWVARNCGVFEGGNLYLDFAAYRRRRGVDMDAASHYMLRRLGLKRRQIPRDYAGRVAMFKVLTRTRRLLVVLDNADQCPQIRAFIPASEGSVVIATSPRKLGGLLTEAAEFVCMWPGGVLPTDTPGQAAT